MQEHLIGASNETITTLAIYRTFVDVSQQVLTHVHSSQFNLARITGGFFCLGERGDWSKENETLFPPPPQSLAGLAACLHGQKKNRLLRTPNLENCIATYHLDIIKYN